MNTQEELQQWEAAAARYLRVQEDSAFAEQNKVLVERRFAGLSGRVLDAVMGNTPNGFRGRVQRRPAATGQPRC